MTRPSPHRPPLRPAANSALFFRPAAPLLALALGACALVGPSPTTTPCPACTLPPPEASPPAPAMSPANWSELPGWTDDTLEGAWAAFRQSCESGRWKNAMANGVARAPSPTAQVGNGASQPQPAVASQANGGSPPAPGSAAGVGASGGNGTAAPAYDWSAACAAARQYGEGKLAAPVLRGFFEHHFVPWSLANPDGTREGMVTGYYEPLLRGSRKREGAFTVPIHAVPDDLLTIEMGDLFPELKGKRVRGRVEGKRVVPYYDRGGIRARAGELRDKVLVWGDDAIEVFFLQIQGSGRVRLPDGSLMRIGYADQNGHPYNSIGRLLVERGELLLEQASMRGIQNWARANPSKLEALLDANPSYVFFRELPAGDQGPIGALGVPLTAARSIAVDPAFVPLGAPVFLATTEPNSAAPLNRLVFAQDTGGAIKGVVRADFFWGFGPEAGALAGRMRQAGRMWVLLPRTSVASDLPPLARR